MSAALESILIAALTWIGRQIAAAVAFAEGIGWAALTGAFTGGSEVWDDLATYDMMDTKHLIKIVLPPMIFSIGQWLRSETVKRAALAEQALDYEKKLAAFGPLPPVG